MLRLILPVVALLVYLPVAQVVFTEDLLGQGLSVKNAVESNKEIAYRIECSLETVAERVESAFENRELSQEKWEQFKQLHGGAKSFHYLFVMANLCYEEAPVEPYGELVGLFARDMMHRLILLDRFCIEIGIEAIPSETI